MGLLQAGNDKIAIALLNHKLDLVACGEALQADAFGNLPLIEKTPREAFQALQAGEAELLPLSQAAGRVTGVGIMPYPPGIPIVMPGENLGPVDGPWVRYIQALQDWGNNFPGFEKEVEGAVHKDGDYHFWCLTSGFSREAWRAMLRLAD